MYSDYHPLQLDENHWMYYGSLACAGLDNSKLFDHLWNLHPNEYHEIQSYGRPVKTPRWQQAYGKDYHYTGRTNEALPIPKCLEPFLHLAADSIAPNLNGILVNWYDGELGHYIGKHRDSRKNMVEGAPIVTMSLGEERTFRLRPWKGRGFVDLKASNGSIFIMLYETNLEWTHEVPRYTNQRGKRISITLRAFC